MGEISGMDSSDRADDTHTHSLAQRLSVFHIYTHKQTHIHQVNG